MDNKRMWLSIALVLGLMFLWLQVLLPWLAKKNNWRITPENNPANVAATAPSSAPTTAATSPSTGPTTIAGLTIKGGQANQRIIIGDVQYDPKGIFANGSYPLGLQLSTRGASLVS